MADLAGLTVMIVEDSFYQAMDAKRTLAAAGATVMGPFSKSSAALAGLSERVPDCALLDVNLGQGASFEVARALQARTIPFLFFTGYDQSALPSEFQGVPRLEKPVENDRLLLAVRKCCPTAAA